MWLYHQHCCCLLIWNIIYIFNDVKSYSRTMNSNSSEFDLYFIYFSLKHFILPSNPFVFFIFLFPHELWLECREHLDIPIRFLFLLMFKYTYKFYNVIYYLSVTFLFFWKELNFFLYVLLLTCIFRYGFGIDY